MQNPKKILVILGHSFADSFCEAMVNTYQNSALESGAEVKTLRLMDLKFDPILHTLDQEIEPDLKLAQEAISWSEHITFVYPTWWGSVPALLKGFIDRTFVSGFAYRFREGKFLPDELLKGRSSRLLITMDVPRFVNQLLTMQPQKNAMTISTLNLTGVKPVRTNFFCDVRTSTSVKRTKWLQKVHRFGYADVNN